MDALRRAEAERKHQAARGKEGAEGAAFPFEDLGDITRIASMADDEAPPPPIPGDNTNTNPGRERAPFDELTLEPLDEPRIGAAADSIGSSTSLGTGRGRQEQTATMPSTRSLASDLGAYFDQTQSAESPRAGPVDMTLEDVASHTLVGAQTVFTASERPRSSRVFVGAGIFVVLLTITIGLVVIFYARQGAPPRMSSPLVASQIEQPVVRELPVIPLDTAPPPTDTALARLDLHGPTSPSGEAGTTVPDAGENSPTSSAAVLPVAGSPESDATPTAGTPPALLPPIPVAALAAAGARPADAAAADVPAAAVPAPRSPVAAAVGPSTVSAATMAPMASIADVGSGEVRIARRRPTLGIDQAVAEGYAAFQRGDLATAEARYNAALARRPQTRDALIGLGAIALKRGNLAQAYRHYGEALERYPGDPVASAALLALTEAGGEGGAARLKLLLDEHPDLAVLHFALGNWYARQLRWADAQLAYFDAARLDAGNADFAFNLAVSLDRLGQGKAALGYYQKSITLADSTGASFNPADALARIGALSATSTP